VKWGERNERVQVELLEVDLERAARAGPLDSWALGNELARRGRLVAAGGRPEELDAVGPAAGLGVAELRRLLIWTAALSSVHRFAYVTTRGTAARAAEAERRAYEEKLSLDRDRLPDLKEQARDLRAEIRRLEVELRRRGGDPERVGGAIDWDRTLAVDDYEPPRYESNEDRRARAVDFFRRIG